MDTLMTQSTGWALIAAFAAALLATAVLTSRGKDVSTKAGFLVGSRRLGWVKSGFSIASTWIWAPALFVAAEQGYLHGWVGVFWFTVPNVACLVLFSFFAHRAREMFPEGFTLSGAARIRYSKRVQVVYLVGLIGLAVSSFAVQLLAGAVVVTALTGISFGFVTLALSAVALSFTIYSGLRGSVITDWLQMIVIALVGMGLSLVVASLAGFDLLRSGMNGLDGTYDSLTSGPGAALFWSFGLSTTIGLLAGPFGDQSFWQRAWATRPGDVRRSFMLGAGVFAIVPIAMSLLGFAAAGAGLGVEDSQLVNLAAIVHWLPTWVTLLFLLYVFSGLVSTMSSQLSSISTFAGHDLTRPGSDNRIVLQRARLSMVALTLAALLIANVPGVEIVQLFIFYGTVRACTLVPTIVMLTSYREVSERGTFWGILGSLVIAIPMSAWGNLTGTVPLIVAASLLAIGISGTSSVVGTWLLRRQDGPWSDSEDGLGVPHPGEVGEPL